MRKSDTSALDAALVLAKRGTPVRDACKLAGVSHATLYTYGPFRAWKGAGSPVEGNREGGISAATAAARAFITGGDSVPVACRKAGVSHTTIYRSAWYRERKMMP